MECPKCGSNQPEASSECMHCGIVFARLHDPSGGRIQNTPQPAGSGDDLNTISSEGRRALIVGSMLALGVFIFPGSRFLLSYLGILIHELGHAAMGWLFGNLAIPAFDFTYGGGVTIHCEQNLLIVALVLLGFGALIYTFRRNRLTMTVLLCLTAFYAALAFTRGHEMVQIAMGHGMELIISGIFLFRAIKGSAIVYKVERPLYALCAVFILLHGVVFAFGLVTSEAERQAYGEAKGGGHWMDFSRLGEEYTGLGLSVIAFLFLLCCLATPVLTYLVFRCESRISRLRSRLLVLET